jgi:hypothetical protein
VAPAARLRIPRASRPVRCDRLTAARRQTPHASRLLFAPFRDVELPFILLLGIIRLAG